MDEAAGTVARGEPGTSRLGAYGPVLRQPVLRRVLPAMLCSAIGDGMSVVAVAWLAVQIAPADQAGLWTGLAVAAYALPATLGTAVLGRLVRGFSGARLVAADASLRAVALGSVAALALLGWLNPIGYVLLLGVSSLLHAWGNAGAYTLVAEQLDEPHRLAGNALLSTFTQAAYVLGPALAGLVTAVAGPGWVIAGDATSFAILAATCWPAGSRAAHATVAGAPEEETGGAWRTVLGQPQLLALIAVTCAFFFLYGPVEVALPIHVARELHASPGLLGAYWAFFGVGAVVGGLAAGLVRNRPLWTLVAVIIVGWGASLLPLGLVDAVLPGLLGFAAGGLIYGPFTAICTALFQSTCPPRILSRVLALRTALTTPSTALGTALGGPVVGVLGGRPTILASGVLTIALGLVVGVVALARRGDRSPAA